MWGSEFFSNGRSSLNRRLYLKLFNSVQCAWWNEGKILSIVICTPFLTAFFLSLCYLTSFFQSTGSGRNLTQVIKDLQELFINQWDTHLELISTCFQSDFFCQTKVPKKELKLCYQQENLELYKTCFLIPVPVFFKKLNLNFYIYRICQIYLGDNIIYKMYFFNQGTCNINGIFLTNKINIKSFLYYLDIWSEQAWKEKNWTATKRLTRLSRNIPIWFAWQDIHQCYI